MSVVPPEPFPTRFSLWAATRFRACWRNVEVSDDGYGEVRTAIRGSGSVLTSSRRPIALEPVQAEGPEAAPLMAGPFGGFKPQIGDAVAKP